MISAIILAYNRSKEVLTTIEKLQNLKATLPYDMELIVVDNASTDHTSELLKTHYPGLKLVTRTSNNGVAGWNDGFALATQPYLLVLDDDSHVENGLTAAIDYLESNPKVGILALNIVDEELNGDPLLDPEEAWKHQQQIMGFIGCGAIIRRELYQKIGGFASWLFIYTHEFDYAIRALDTGYDTRFFELGTVVHRASKLNRTNKRLRIYSTRNEMAIVYTHFGNRKTKYLARTFINNLKFIKREGIKSGYYVLLGALAFLKMKKQLPIKAVGSDVQDFYANNVWSTKRI